MTELPQVTRKPSFCNDQVELIVQSLESQSLSSEQILDIFKFDSSAKMIEIGTDDFVTYANKEATIQLKVVSKTS